MKIYCNDDMCEKKELPSEYTVRPLAELDISRGYEPHLIGKNEYYLNIKKCYCNATKCDIPTFDCLCISKNGKPYEGCKYFRQGVDPLAK